MNSFEKQLYEFLQITNPVILQEELNKVRDGYNVDLIRGVK